MHVIANSYEDVTHSTLSRTSLHRIPRSQTKGVPQMPSGIPYIPCYKANPDRAIHICTLPSTPRLNNDPLSHNRISPSPTSGSNRVIPPTFFFPLAGLLFIGRPTRSIEIIDLGELLHHLNPAWSARPNM